MPASQWILGSNALNQPIAELSSATPTGQKTVYMSGYTGGTGVTVAPTLGFTGGSCTTNPAISGVLGGTSMTYYQTGLGVCTLVPSVTFTGGSYTTSPTVTLAFAETVPVINNNTTAFNFDNMTGGGKLVAQNNPVISLPTLYNPTISSPLGTSNNTTLTFTANGSCLFSKYNSAASLQSNCYLAVNRGNYTTATMGYVTTVSGYLVSGGDVDIATAQTISYQPTYHGTYMQLPSGLVMNLGEAGSAVTLAATATGSGYTGSPVCTVTGGTLHTGSQDTCTITLSGGGLAVTGYVNNGTYTKAPAIAVSGVSGGSGFFQYLGFAAATTPSESVWADPSGVLAAGGGSFNLATAWAVIAPNGLTANGLGNRTSLTVAAGAALGTGSPVAACAANTTCGWNGGVVNIYADTAPTTGVVFTLTDTVTHANYPGCVYEIFPASSSYVKTGPQLALTTELYDTNQSYTVQTYNVSSALTTTTYYVADYACF